MIPRQGEVVGEGKGRGEVEDHHAICVNWVASLRVGHEYRRNAIFPAEGDLLK